jgi:hypothetical protein
MKHFALPVLLALGLALGPALGLTPQSLAAQDVLGGEEVSDTTPQALVRRPVSPGGAFLRSILVPGWGQASVGAYNRAGFYFGVDAASAWMFFKTRRTLDSARKILGRVEAEVTAQVVSAGVSDLQKIAAALDDNEQVTDARALVEARSQQREDWLAFGLFMVLIGGADAFVAGHLADFPDALKTGFRVTPDGGFEAGLSVTLPFLD